MATWQCAECTAVYSVGAPKCPECGSKLRVNEATQPSEEDNEMTPKITAHGGPSVDGFDVDPESGERTPVDEATEDNEASPDEASEKSEPDTSGTATQRRSRRRNESAAE